MNTADASEVVGKKPFARPKLLRYYAFGIFVIWGVLALSVLFLFLMFPLGTPRPFLYSFVAFAVLVVVHTPTAAFLRCPHCRRRVTIQTGFRVHPNAAARNWGWFSGWARIILDAALDRDFVCMHCGNWVGMPGDERGGGQAAGGDAPR